MNLTEKRIDGEEIFKGKIISVYVDSVTLPNGERAKREVVRHPGGVCIAPLTRDNELVFVRQFRYPNYTETLELPAGKLEAGEDPLLAAIRELSEETGAEGKVVPLGEMYPTPGYVDEIIRLYVGTDLEFKEMHTDDDEFIEICKIPLEKAVEMVLNGEIRDGKSQILILKINELKRRNGL